MQSYNLEVGWSADQYAAASKALQACTIINPANPMAVAEAIHHMFKIITAALPLIEDEAERRDHALAPGKGDYYNEMHNLASALHEIVNNVLEGGK